MAMTDTQSIGTVIVFDEGHFAKNLKVGKSQGSSQAALKVSELQDTLSLARVRHTTVYQPATQVCTSQTNGHAHRWCTCRRRVRPSPSTWPT